MRGLRVHCHAKIPQTDRDAVESKGQAAKGLVKVETVVSRFRLAQRGEFIIRGPIELA